MNRTILITGSTDGIGKLAVIKLAKDGHQVYLHGRSSEKLQRVIEEVKVASKNEKIKGFVADLSDLDAVRQMAKAVKAEISQLDVLINNAGVFKSPNALNKDGLDLRLVVNYLAPYVLTDELLPVLEASENARIINLSSAAQSTVSKGFLTGTTQVSTQEAYAQSKLALTIWSFDLAKKQSDISVIAVNPGSLLNTRMVQEAYGRYWSSADKGANILYDLAVSQQYEGITGKYFDNDKGGFGAAHADAYKEVLIKQLMETTIAVLEKY
ncbi:MAG: SDR family NAD(P)-dependent oxidoreductase [Bacteroidota bacterium]